MFDKIKNIIKKQQEGIWFKVLRHVALTTHGIDTYAKHQKIPYDQVCDSCFELIKQIIEFQVSNNLPILTI